MVQITADGQVIFSPTTTSADPQTATQTITLADGTTAYLQQTTKGTTVEFFNFLFVFIYLFLNTVDMVFFYGLKRFVVSIKHRSIHTVQLNLHCSVLSSPKINILKKIV